MERLFAGKRVLITGGAGFIGSNLTARLVDEGARVTILDDFYTGRRENLCGLEGHYELVSGSVADRELVAHLVAEAQIVFHLAARNIIASTRNPYEDFQTNIGGTLNVMMAARSSRTERVLYSSSASVYGNPRYLPINEDDRISLLTPYAASKYGGEAYCQAFYESYGVSVVVMRYSNVFGPRQDPKNPYCGVVAKFMEKAMNGCPPEIHGDGQQTRDFTFVEDVVEATLLAALSKKAEGEIFNVGTGTETNVNALASLILELCAADIAPIYIDRRDIDNIRRRVLNVEKIRRVLRWVPNATLTEGLRRTLRWLRTTGAASDSSDQQT
jgi:nucleoside-diphosphate-sugar epimerase